jgi:hypothetical protein
MSAMAWVRKGVEKRAQGRRAHTALINCHGNVDLVANTACVLAEEDVGVLAGDEGLWDWGRGCEDGSGEAESEEGHGGLHGWLGDVEVEGRCCCTLRLYFVSRSPLILQHFDLSSPWLSITSSLLT